MSALAPIAGVEGLEQFEFAPAPGSHRGPLAVGSLLAADALAVIVAVGSARLVGPAWPAGKAPLIAAAACAVWVVVALLRGLYGRDTQRIAHSTVDDLTQIATVATISAWAIWVGGWALGLGAVTPGRLVPPWLLAIALVTVGRSASRALVRRHAWFVQNTLILGAGDIGQTVARRILQHPEYGLNVVGFLDSMPKERRADLGELTLLGAIDDLTSVVEEHDVRRVIVAFSNDPSSRLVQTLRELGSRSVQVDVVPRLFELVGPGLALHQVGGMPLLGVTRHSRSSLAQVAKRALDIVVASALLVMLAPAFAYLALRIRLDSSGPLLFRQVRLGKGMKPFTLLKFRSLKHGAGDAPHREYMRRVSGISPVAPEDGLYKAGHKEVTRVGQWLRQTSLDELPQLVNVLRGEMSLVGPRPCIPYELEYFEPHHYERFDVPAGLTGLWQVTARARSTYREALDLDVKYARASTLGLDLQILLKTPVELVRATSTR